MYYPNRFGLSKELGQAISNIISQKEGSNYICKTIAVTIKSPEHKRFNEATPVDPWNSYGPGYKTLDIMETKTILEKYGRWVKGIIPEKKHNYLIVMSQESYQLFSELFFMTKEEIELALQKLSVIHKEYSGDFNADILTEKFPYLQNLFSYLDEWREKTGRVTVDTKVLNKGLKKTLGYSKPTIRQ